MNCLCAIKALATVFLVSLSNHALAETSSQCPGEEGYYFTNYKHRNPTRGGFVSNRADVQDTDNMIFIGPNVSICGSARVLGQARIFGDAVVNGATVKDKAEISENAVIDNGAEVSGNARINGYSRVSGFVEVSEDAVITDSARIVNLDSEKLTRVAGKARVGGSATVKGDAIVEGRARVNGSAVLSGDVRVDGTAIVKGYTKRSTGSISKETLDDPDYEAIAKAKREHDAYLAKCAEDEALKKAAANAAAVKDTLEKQQAEDARKKRLSDIRKGIKELGKKTGYAVSFEKPCVFTMIGSSKETSLFNFTKDSTSLERRRGKSGFSVRPNGSGSRLTFETEIIEKKYNVLKFDFEDPSVAKRFSDDFEFYFDQCQKGADMGQ